LDLITQLDSFKFDEQLSNGLNSMNISLTQIKQYGFAAIGGFTSLSIIVVIFTIFGILFYCCNLICLSKCCMNLNWCLSILILEIGFIFTILFLTISTVLTIGCSPIDNILLSPII